MDKLKDHRPSEMFDNSFKSIIKLNNTNNKLFVSS